MSVWISGERNITFLHIPKTAGTSMIDWLLTNQGESQHIKWDTHPKHSTLLEQIPNPNFTFTVVRNPWDRMVSMYHYMKDIAVNEGSKWLELNNISSGIFPTFDYWITNLDSFQVPAAYWFNGLNSQIEWIDRSVDLIIRYEKLEEELEQVRDVINLRVPFPHHYKSKHTYYTDYYTSNTRNLVDKIFEKDIELFKYTFKIRK
jgi:hypothetical protein